MEDKNMLQEAEEARSQSKRRFSERLQQLMYDRHLRQIDVVRLCEPISAKYGVTINKSHLSHYLKANFEPKQDKIAVLAEALDVSPAWLMGFDVPEKDEDPSAYVAKGSKEEIFVKLFSALSEDDQQKIVDEILRILSSRK